MNEEKPEEALPINPIYSWLRVILWLVPFSFLIPSTAVFIAGRYLGLNDTISILLASSSFALFLTGAGWCDFKLADKGWKNSFNLPGSVGFYILCQVILVIIIFYTLLVTGALD
jgi:hypothetical protein